MTKACFGGVGQINLYDQGLFWGVGQPSIFMTKACFGGSAGPVSGPLNRYDQGLFWGCRPTFNLYDQGMFWGVGQHLYDQGLFWGVGRARFWAPQSL